MGVSAAIGAVTLALFLFARPWLERRFTAVTLALHLAANVVMTRRRAVFELSRVRARPTTNVGNRAFLWLLNSAMEAATCGGATREGGCRLRQCACRLSHSRHPPRHFPSPPAADDVLFAFFFALGWQLPLG